MKLIRILAYVRLALIPLALAQVTLERNDFPTSRYELVAWLLVAAQALVALLLLGFAYRWRRRLRYLAVLNVAADAALATALMFVFAWEPGQPLRSLVFLVVLEAALFFRLSGGLLTGVLTLPVFVGLELWREAQFDTTTRYDALDAPRARRCCPRQHCRAARGHGAQSGQGRRGASRRGGAAARRARAADRPARGDEPCSARARLFARSRRRVRCVRPGAARPASIRPRRDPPRGADRMRASWRRRASAPTTFSRRGARSACPSRCWRR